MNVKWMERLFRCRGETTNFIYGVTIRCERWRWHRGLHFNSYSKTVKDGRVIVAQNTSWR